MLKGMGIRPLLGMIIAAMGVGILAFYGIALGVDQEVIGLGRDEEAANLFDVASLLGIAAGASCVVVGVVVIAKGGRSP